MLLKGLGWVEGRTGCAGERWICANFSIYRKDEEES